MEEVEKPYFNARKLEYNFGHKNESFKITHFYSHIKFYQLYHNDTFEL